MKLISMTLIAALTGGAAVADDRLAEAIADPARGEGTARDAHRHPYETLGFFGIQPDHSVLEIWPGGGGWYSRILAPYLKENGRLTVALFGPDVEHRFARFFAQADEQFRREMVADTERNGDIATVNLFAPKHIDLGEAESYDMILTFRNLHNWMMWDQTEAHLEEFFRVLKPGGVLGVTDHRANAALPIDRSAGSGYVDEAWAIKVIQDAGFVLVDVADINDNPRDTKDYENGVWTLPPTYRLGDTDRDKYTAIGESDRFTLKFVKPAE